MNWIVWGVLIVAAILEMIKSIDKKGILKNYYPVFAFALSFIWTAIVFKACGPWVEEALKFFAIEFFFGYMIIKYIKQIAGRIIGG